MSSHQETSNSRALSSGSLAFRQCRGRFTRYSFAAIAILGTLAVTGSTANASNRNVEVALAGRSDLSIFYQALLITGVARELKENTEYTVFAPTNEAFAAIDPSVYPCFYATQCRVEVASVLRNHIVPENKSITRFSRWGGDIPTIGRSHLNIEEPYIGEYRVNGHRVLDQNASNEFMHEQGDLVSLYRIDGVIASDQDLAPFRLQSVAYRPNTMTQKTVTTYSSSPVDYSQAGEAKDVTIKTKTVTRTTTTQ